MNLTQKLPWVRLGAEGLVIFVGVLVALAVDRWVTGLDERGLEASYVAQLVENFTADSLRIAESLEAAEDRRRLAVEILSGHANVQGAEPEVFLKRFEQIAWWAPVEYSREAWDELGATGRLSLIRDEAVRRSLSQYYNRIEWLALLEDDWDEQLEQYEVRARGILPPLMRLQVVGTLPEGSPAVPVGSEDVLTVLRTFDADTAMAVDLGQLAAIYGVQLDLYESVMQDIEAVLRLLRGAL